MNLDRVGSGRNLPEEFNVIIEIPMNADPIKYEVDKELAAPIDEVCNVYHRIKTPDDLPAPVLDQIRHFFEHYKDLEPGKWVKIEGWLGPDAARAEILAGVARYGSAEKKPRF